MKLLLKLFISVLSITILSLTVYVSINYNNIFVNQTYINSTTINVNQTFVNQTIVNTTIVNQTTVVNQEVQPKPSNENEWLVFTFTAKVSSLETLNMLLPDGKYLIITPDTYGKDVIACDCSIRPVNRCVVDSNKISSEPVFSNYTTSVLTWEDINKMCNRESVTLKTLPE